jgi:hypothetical protein
VKPIKSKKTTSMEGEHQVGRTLEEIVFCNQEIND